MSARSYIVDDREKKTFLLDREVLVSDDILRQEMSRIFGRCWIYVGHDSELKKPGDFRSRKVAGRPVIFVRDQAGKVHCLFNTCRHRGAIVCTPKIAFTAPVMLPDSWNFVFATYSAAASRSPSVSNTCSSTGNDPSAMSPYGVRTEQRVMPNPA